MKSMIKEMYSTRRGNYDQIPLSDDYDQSVKLMDAAVKKFLESLTLSQKELFHEAYEFIGEMNAEFALDHFVEGFKFGLLMGLEIGEK